MSSGPLAQFPIASFVRLGRVRLVRKKKTDCPSLTILGRITNHRIMELPLHARLYFCRFGSIWRNAKHTNRRSMPSGRLALFPVHHLSVLTRPALMDPAYNFVKG